MNKSFIKIAVAKSILTIALVGGATIAQAQVLGGGATGGLGGSLGGTLGGGTFDHGDTLRRTGSGALDRTRDVGGRVKDRAAGTRDTVQGAASSATSNVSTQASGAANGAASAATN